MEIPQNVQHQLNQFQQLQQQAQAIAMQKQTVDMQIQETSTALKELENTSSDADVYKSAGNILIKVDKKELDKDLEDKLETLKLREKTINRQQERVMNKLEEMQSSIQGAMNAAGLSKPGMN
jgi:prefoldin beta subunit